MELNYFRYKCPKIRTTLILPGHILTPMFAKTTLPPFSLYKFLVPSLPPITVVKRVIAALDEQHSQTIMLPFYTNFIPYIGHLPSFLRDFAQWVSEYLAHRSMILICHFSVFQLSGADYAMENFVKLSSRRPEEGPAPEGTDSSKTE